MTEPDRHRITNEAELRALVGEELPGVGTKILDRLDAPIRAFLERTPFLEFGHRNVLESPQFGLTLRIPGTPETLRIDGRAERTGADESVARPIDAAIEIDDRDDL